jgi:hypothetical protein
MDNQGNAMPLFFVCLCFVMSCVSLFGLGVLWTVMDGEAPLHSLALFLTFVSLYLTPHTPPLHFLWRTKRHRRNTRSGSNPFFFFFFCIPLVCLPPKNAVSLIWSFWRMRAYPFFSWMDVHKGVLCVLFISLLSDPDILRLTSLTTVLWFVFNEPIGSNVAG